MTKIKESISVAELNWMYIQAGLKQLHKKETKKRDDKNKTPDDEKAERI